MAYPDAGHEQSTRSRLWRDLTADSDQRGIRSAIEMEVLARRKACQCAAQERTSRAEFLGIAEPSRGDRFDLARTRFLVGNILARHRGLGHLMLAIGVKPLGQQIVDSHVVLDVVVAPIFARS